jgi:hypothetical protein
VTLGTWNSVTNSEIHPVEVNFANTGQFGARLYSESNPSFPTTGTMALLMRTAGRAVTDFTPPSVGGATGSLRDLAFNTGLAASTETTKRTEDSPGNVVWQGVTAEHYEQIDNGRLPLFDVVDDAHPLHHLPPSLFKAWDPTGTLANRVSRALPGELHTLPWGQRLFDYFTALPLSNGGPYEFDTSDPDQTFWSFAPRVDQGGLRVHGRINLNAAPWKVLAGLPLVPIQDLGGLPTAIVEKVRSVYADPGNLVDAQPIGPELAQAIVAYRDARQFVDNAGNDVTGNYDTGVRAFGSTTTDLYGRGWTHSSPAARRGTGFMTVGELANIRHTGAQQFLGADGSAYRSRYRIDVGVMGGDIGGDRNNEDFVTAAAMLIALGDWMSVRSHVYTVYGHIRGVEDRTITDPALRLLDTDARAIRFQETIDRLPVLDGRGRPVRIGERTVGKYTDINND